MLKDSDESRAGSFLFVGAILAAIGVGLGAFGAHGLQAVLDAPSMETFQTAVRYQTLHATGVVLIGVLLAVRGIPREAQVWLGRAGIFLALGTVVFSGSLYLLLASGVRWLGAVTPLGGLAFILGWLSLGLAGLRMRRLPRTGA